MRAPDFWSGPPGLLAAALAPASAAWTAAGRLRQALAKPYRAPVPVICVGNLVAGGAGKTPVTIALAAVLQHRGIAVHVVTRGYGGRSVGPLPVDILHHDAEAVGDEALLIARQAPCWLARDRAAGVRAAVAAGVPAILLDDGFQNPAVAKDLSLLVVDAEYGFGNGRVIPAGPLREDSRLGLARADAIVLLGRGTGAAPMPECGKPILRASIEPLAAKRLRGARLVAFAGIGRPAKFFTTLREAGADLVATRTFPDHHRFTEREIAALRRQAEREEAQLITTAKDLMRLPPDWRRGIEALDIAVRRREPAFLETLMAPLFPDRSNDRFGAGVNGG